MYMSSTLWPCGWRRWGRGGKLEPLPIKQLLDMAVSTDCFYIVPEVLNDFRLGRFYAKNGFIPEVEHVPDSVIELLDFEQLGRKTRIAEGGVYTERARLRDALSLVVVIVQE